MRLRGFSATIGPNAPWTKVIEVTVPTGESWSIQEVRFLTSSDAVLLRLLVRVGASAETFIDTLGTVANALKLPYPVSFTVPSGGVIVLEAANPTAAQQTVWLELLYEPGR